MRAESVVGQRLRELVGTINRSELFPAYNRQASTLVGTNPFAYALAVSLNRQTVADIIWTVPYDLQRALGHLDPTKIAEMPIEELDRVFKRLPHKPRFVNDAAQTVKELSQLVVERYDGDAAGIWRNRSAAEVKRTFKSIYGVGQQIANLSVLLLEQRYNIHFSDLDHQKMDIKADSHTCRVLHRLGVAADDSPDEAVAAARRINPDYPGELDAPLWVIGRRWCKSTGPICSACPLQEVCEYAGA
jgi:uncharacterized HhH-GPD family protein